MLTDLTSVSRLLDWSNYAYGLAAFITLAATLGVIYFGRTASSLKDAQVKQYQTEADAKIAAANLQAAKAFKQGEEAQAGAADAVATAEKAKAQSAEAHAQAEHARAEAAAANAEAERSKKERAGLELRVQELIRSNSEQAEQIAVFKKDAEPRKISNQQRTAVVAQLKSATAGMDLTNPIPFFIMATDFEAHQFSNQVVQVLTEAGFKVQVFNTLDQSGLGAAVRVRSTTSAPNLAGIILGAFVTHQVPIGLAEDPSVADATFQIVIGAKLTSTNHPK